MNGKSAASSASSTPQTQRPRRDEPPVADGVRISKLMSERGLCSRREADEHIAHGRVFVNGVRVTELGARAAPDSKITLSREARDEQNARVTILLHKPIGYVSGQPEPGFRPAASLIEAASQWHEHGKKKGALNNGTDRHPKASPLTFSSGHLRGLAPAGRLDIDSTGLLVLTQDGRIAKQLIGDDSKIEKEYLVRVSGTLIENGLALLNHGLSLDGKPLRPAHVEWLNDDQLRFILCEGKKRQIRRMCEQVGLKVVGLKRVRIGNVRLGSLPIGKWRYLREDEAF